MTQRTLSLNNQTVPRFLYGTAWKEDQTERLTMLALQNGFRGIDTANQRRHYDEAAVGTALAAVIDAGLVKRDDLFLNLFIRVFSFSPEVHGDVINEESSMHRN